MLNTTDEDVRESFKLIYEQANYMLESMKHSIVLLQIAKNTVHPINGIYHGPPPTDNSFNKIDLNDESGMYKFII